MFLSLVAMANDAESMYAAVKALVFTSRKGGADVARDMKRFNAYQLLATLFKRKRSLLNTHILNLSFSLALVSSWPSSSSDDSTAPSPTPSNTIASNCVTNVRAFESLLADLDIWFGGEDGGDGGGESLQRALQARI